MIHVHYQSVIETRLLLGALAAKLGLVLAGLAFAAVLTVAPLALPAPARLLRCRARAINVPKPRPSSCLSPTQYEIQGRGKSK